MELIIGELASLHVKRTTRNFHRYAGADHGFMNDDGDRYSEKEARDSWKKALAFMRRHCA
jgi:dienelactone hydrolase